MHAVKEQIHLFRGAPAVRSWSKYQAISEEWTLCGVHRVPNGRTGKPAAATEEPGTVSCLNCLGLMRSRARREFKAYWEIDSYGREL